MFKCEMKTKQVGVGDRYLFWPDSKDFLSGPRFFFLKNSAHVEEFGAPKISLAGGGQGTTRSGYREQGQAHCGEPHKGPRLETLQQAASEPALSLVKATLGPLRPRDRSRMSQNSVSA